MIRILIADDHAAIRKGVRMILSGELPGLEFGEAVDGKEVLKKTRQEKWDLIILDMDMRGKDGLEVLKQLQCEKTHVPVLMFSMHEEGQLALRALKAGAKGYLPKETVDTELLTAVQRILAGKKYITTGLAEQLVEQMQNPEKNPHESLSDREYQTLILISKGKTISQIAENLSLSVATVSTFRARVLEKTGMKNTAELVSYVLRKNLV